MSRKCPECEEGGGRPHLPDCSFAPLTEEREAFIRDHAVEIVRKKEAKIRRQAAEIDRLNQRIKAIAFNEQQKEASVLPPRTTQSEAEQMAARHQA